MDVPTAVGPWGEPLADGVIPAGLERLEKRHKVSSFVVVGAAHTEIIAEWLIGRTARVAA